MYSAIFALSKNLPGNFLDIGRYKNSCQLSKNLPGKFLDIGWG